MIMYKVVDKIPSNFDVRRHGEPVLTLEDEYGGQSVIIRDDHCFVLQNGSEHSDRNFATVSHWHPEVAIALADFLTQELWKRAKQTYMSAETLSGIE